jgi:fibronectin type 3 domain-containing protein
MKYLFFFLLTFCTLAASAQKKTARHIPAPTKMDTLHISLHLKAQNYGDSIVVRWAPGNSVSWLLSQKNGFLLKRKVFRKGQKNVFTLVDSSSKIISPWKLDTWGNYFKSSHDSLSAVAAQIVFAKTVAFDNGKQGNSFNNIAEKYNEQQSRFGFALLLADFDPAIADGLGLRFVERQVRKDLYYLYTLVPAQTRANVSIDTGRALISGSQIYAHEKFSAITAIAGDRTIRLYWNSNMTTNNFSGFIIERSSDGKIFSRLNRLPFVSFKAGKEKNKPVEFNDSVSQDYKNYYYRVTGINAFGDHSDPSPVLVIHAVDLTAPHYPVISSIKNMKGSGAIQLQWIKKEKEKDFKGYVVGRSTNLKGPFIPISNDFLPFETNSFTDDHPSSDAPNYYIVAAVDTAGNAGRSMPAYMNVEDHMPPAQPVGLTGKIDSNGHVSVHWNWGKEADLAGYKIFFANAPDHQFTPLTSDLVTDSLFTDSITLKTLTKKIYYKVIAYDRSMNPSPSSAVLVLDKPDKVPPVSAIIKEFRVTDSAVIIRWYPSASKDVAQQILYRKQDNSGEWISVSRFKPKDSVFTDKSVASKQNYIYSIETIDSSGLHSGKSFPLHVYVYGKGYKNEIKKFEVVMAQDKNTVSMHWVVPAGEISYYILFKGRDNKGLKMAGNIPGGNTGYEDKTMPGTYQYAIKAVYKDGEESALSDIKTIMLTEKEKL